MEPRSTARILTYLIVIALLGFIAIQFVRPSLENPPGHRRAAGSAGGEAGSEKLLL